MLENIKLGILLIFLLIDAGIDIKYKKISVGLALLCMGIGSIFTLVAFPINFMQFLGIVPGCCLMIIAYYSKEKIGLGDGLVIAVIGVYLGLWKCLLVLFIAGVLASLVGIIGIGLKKWNRKTALAFIPFLFIACVVTLFIY